MTKLKYKLETNFTKPKSKKDTIKKAQTDLDALYRRMIKEMNTRPYYTTTTITDQSTHEIVDHFNYSTGWILI